MTLDARHVPGRTAGGGVDRQSIVACRRGCIVSAVELDRTATPATSGKGWIDGHGFQGPLEPGVGPRRDPLGSFPTGPEVGTRLPDVVAPNGWGETVDVHRHRSGRPAVVMFNRSVVW